jgi:nicotinate-nucleotide adenylyltransferase
VRVGLLGGTFNPPHIGHLVCAMEARDQLGLDRVQLLVAGTPPHKEVEADPGAEVRLELAELAAALEPGLEVSRIETQRPGPSFTVDTLRALHDDAPEQELTFIVGGDMALALPDWREPEAILELAELAVAERQEVRREQILERLDGMAGVPRRIRFFDMPRLDISSSDVRARVAAGRPVRHLVPAAVAERVAALGLYARVGEAAWA